MYYLLSGAWIWLSVSVAKSLVDFVSSQLSGIWSPLKILLSEEALLRPSCGCYLGIDLLLCICVQSFLTLQTHGLLVGQTPLSMEFSRQEYWSGQPFASPGDLPNPGTEHMSLAPPALRVESLLLCHIGGLISYYFCHILCIVLETI